MGSMNLTGAPLILHWFHESYRVSLDPTESHRVLDFFFINSLKGREGLCGIMML